MTDPNSFIKNSIINKNSNQISFSPETSQYIYIDTKSQILTLLSKDNSKILLRADISTAKNGLGQEQDSFKTPTGWHIVRAKIGDNHPKGAVFIGRRWTKEIYSKNLEKQHPNRDWILTRILWLSGIEPGHNRLGNKDTMRRYIYIHGTNETHKLGTPASCGCIRMKDEDLIKLYDLIKPYDQIFID